MLKGATRCIKRMGLFRGDNVTTRYRRLDMRCTRTKTEASITISRGTTIAPAADLAPDRAVPGKIPASSPPVHHRAGSAPIARLLTFGFISHWSPLVTVGRNESRILSMSISSVAAPAAVQPANNTPPAKPPDAGKANDADDAGAAQPAAPAPLPPGQGTRIDQLV